MGSIPERGHGVWNARLRSPYAEDSEPASESCMNTYADMKIQRKPALTVSETDAGLHQSGWYRRAFGPFFGTEGFFIL